MSTGPTGPTGPGAGGAAASSRAGSRARSSRVKAAGSSRPRPPRRAAQVGRAARRLHPLDKSDAEHAHREGDAERRGMQVVAALRELAPFRDARRLSDAAGETEGTARHGAEDEGGEDGKHADLTGDRDRRQDRRAPTT